MKKRKWLKRTGLILAVVIIVTNVIAFNHAWKFTHYTTAPVSKTMYERLGWSDKILYGFTGIDNPRPTTGSLPVLPYETVHIKSNVRLECWMIPAAENKGTVLMFHGYTGDKSKLLGRAYVLHDLGYNVMLTDFMGAGGSEGNNVTIGYKEAINVRDCYRYLEQKDVKNIVLFGSSMGAAALMKAIKDYRINPSCIIIEAPFSTMYHAVTNRFDMVGAPYFPMAQLLVFWGGLQNGFWGFGHQPVEYARHINCPTLLIFGAKDDRVKNTETDDIYRNLPSSKKLVVYKQAGHVNYLDNYKKEWTGDVQQFLEVHCATR